MSGLCSAHQHRRVAGCVQCEAYVLPDERPRCRDVSLLAARESLSDAATRVRAAVSDALVSADHVRAAVSDLGVALEHAVVALLQGPTMRVSMRPMPEPSAEAEARWRDALARLDAARETEDRRRAADSETRLRQRQSLRVPVGPVPDALTPDEARRRGIA